MTKRTLRIGASILILLALALLVIGLANESTALWTAGLVATAVAMAMSFATRWVGSGPD